jgi:hypothetical protein
MNPYPFELLNHFTVPCTYVLLLTETWMHLSGELRRDARIRQLCNLRGVYQKPMFSQ